MKQNKYLYVLNTYVNNTNAVYFILLYSVYHFKQKCVYIIKRNALTKMHILSYFAITWLIVVDIITI